MHIESLKYRFSSLLFFYKSLYFKLNSAFGCDVWMFFIKPVIMIIICGDEELKFSQFDILCVCWDTPSVNRVLVFDNYHTVPLINIQTYTQIIDCVKDVG